MRVGSTVIAIDSNEQCVKYEGEERECTIGDYNLAISFKTLYENNNQLTE